MHSKNYDQLSQLGRRQARCLGRYWATAEAELDALVVGPLVRHRQSAEELLIGLEQAGGSPPRVVELADWSEHQGIETVEQFTPILAETDTELAELQLALAELEGAERVRCYFEIFRRVSRRWVRGELDLTRSGLEAWPDFRIRVRAGLERIVAFGANDRTVAVMTSAGAVASAVGDLLGLAEERTLELSWVIRNSAVSEARELGGQLNLLSLNGVSHLDDPDQITFI